MEKRRRNSGAMFYLVMMGLLLAIVYIYNNKDTLLSIPVSEASFEVAVGDQKAYEIKVVQQADIPTGYVVFRDENGDRCIFYVSDVNQIQGYLKSNDTQYVLTGVMKESYFMSTIIPILLLGFVMVFVFFLMGGGMAFMDDGSKGGDKVMNFGRSRARKMSDSDKRIRLTDVAGLEEEKEDLADIIDFLKNPQKYNEMGARVPKGILLEGPPGTGKTLLAKAVAGEAGVEFFSISGSDFVEMFVGVGASRVRDMFAEAKRNKPCIIFIDEIDAVGRKRGAGMGGGHDEREQTLNQLLVEMDGFEVNSGIIVMAATNRVDILDQALLRPGRFDRQVVVGRPDVNGRMEILKIHSRNKKLGEDVDLDRVARTTAGYTGADLENLMNEAAIIAVKDDRKFIREADVEKAFVKVSIGTEKKSRVIDEHERSITAYHESGHAILFKVLPLMDPVHTISIIPTGLGAAGYTMPVPAKDRMYMTKEEMRQHIMVCLGGRIAEELIFGDATTGASQDIKDATNSARAMVMDYGMSERLGMIHYGDDDQEVFLGRDLAHTRAYSEQTAAIIDEEIKTIVSECYDKAKEIIIENMDVLHKSAKLLLEREKITTEEFEALF